MSGSSSRRNKRFQRLLPPKPAGLLAQAPSEEFELTLGLRWGQSLGRKSRLGGEYILRCELGGMAVIENQVLVVEDDPDLQSLLVSHLTDEGYRVDAASSLEEALSRCRVTKFRLIVADILLGENKSGGIDLLESLRKQTPVILISGNATREVLARAINHGAMRFVEKPFELSELSAAVGEVLNSAPSSENARSDVNAKRLMQEKQLTPREQEVFQLLMQGQSNREIAESLGTAERTVKAHLSAVFKKFSVKSRAELLSQLL